MSWGSKWGSGVCIFFLDPDEPHSSMNGCCRVLCLCLKKWNGISVDKAMCSNNVGISHDKGEMVGQLVPGATCVPAPWKIYASIKAARARKPGKPYLSKRCSCALFNILLIFIIALHFTAGLETRIGFLSVKKEYSSSYGLLKSWMLVSNCHFFPSNSLLVLFMLACSFHLLQRLVVGLDGGVFYTWAGSFCCNILGFVFYFYVCWRPYFPHAFLFPPYSR